MGSRLEKSRRWPGLLLALVLTLPALTGRMPLRAEEQNPGKMLMGFAPSTPPVKPGIICKGRQYAILARPYVLLPDGAFSYQFHQEATTVAVSTPLVGTITPPNVRLQRGVGAPSARFLYSSDKTGQESLLFVTTMPRPVVITNVDQNTGSRTELRVDHAEYQFNFEVKECPYKVTMVVWWAQNFAGAQGELTGFRATTRLVRNEDGTFESTAPLKFYQILTNVPDCIISLGNMEVPVHITGKLVPEPGDPAGWLKLTFEYGTGTLQGDARCKEVYVSRSTTVDLSSSNETIEFPGGHRATKLAINVPPGVRLSITVELETISTQ